MIYLFLVLIILASGLLALVVLIQNPKGGGLSGTFGGFGNQVMGVKQTTDVLEKGTWLFAGIVGVLCIVSTLFMTGASSTPGSDVIQKLNTSGNKTAPANTVPGAVQQPSTINLGDSANK